MHNSLNYKRIGTGRPLVLLHGWGWSSAIWKPLIPQLSPHFELTLIDLPGCGGSPLLHSDYTLETIAPVLLDCAPAHAIWLGWSLGGLFAWWLAIHCPERVEKLVTVAASPCFVSADGWPGITADTLDRFAGALQKDFKKTLAEFLELQLRGSLNYPTLLDELRDQMDASPPALSALAGGLNILETADLRAELDTIKCPTLHLFGQRDRIVPVAVAEFLKGQTGIFSRSGHLPFLTEEENFLQTLVEFAAG